jgi:serine/threonine protein kinase
MLFNEVPFYGYSIGDLLNQIEKKSGKNLIFPETNPICQLTKDFLCKVLEADPTKRISWSQFREHPVFSKEHSAMCQIHRQQKQSWLMKKFKLEQPKGKRCLTGGVIS